MRCLTLQSLTPINQRVNTMGRLAPATSCNEDDTAHMPYTAGYNVQQAAESE